MGSRCFSELRKLSTELPPSINRRNLKMTKTIKHGTFFYARVKVRVKLTTETCAVATERNAGEEPHVTLLPLLSMVRQRRSVQTNTIEQTVSIITMFLKGTGLASTLIRSNKTKPQNF